MVRKYCNKSRVGSSVAGNRTENATEPNIDQVKCATETDFTSFVSLRNKDGDLVIRLLFK